MIIIVLCVAEDIQLVGSYLGINMLI